MYLKSIEVHGFKSFANKIKFEFHNGITGIVGPNGSGKSNVADAVRWVLGEQRIKQLRGTKMEDVIFAGTENRKPLGSAMVAITLDNSDHKLPIEFEEVTVSRRIFRSGESEYRINGSVCRLKDINELFYDTGIGKEGYSIIGQGQIDKILSGKPEERRELFDEAAGIVKYKRRKISTQKKLEDEHGNLLRVNDILSELEKQVGPLERQSETAKKYLAFKEELKNYDINLFLLDVQSNGEKLNEVDEKIKIASEDTDTTRKEYEDTKDQVLPTFSVNDKLENDDIESLQHFTQPPARYTEAKLIKDLEELGIGRPSTYATIIDTIKKRGYVDVVEKKFVPTEIGFEITDKLQMGFSNIINVEYTANMEDELDKIAEGNQVWYETLDRFYKDFEPSLKKAFDLLPKKEVKETGEVCPECGKPLVIRKGRYGEFTACSGYPSCKYVKTEPRVEEEIIDCPNCGGKIVEKRSKRGKIFYGCNNYPTCKTAYWDKPIGRLCPECKNMLTQKDKKIKCSSCNYSEELESD